MSINLQPDLFNQEIVQEKDGELLVSSLVVAENVGYEHQSVIRLINSYKREFEQFRPFDLKSIGQNGTSSYKTWYELDENQVTFLLQLMKNNKYTVKFKLNLTKAFSIMKNKLLKKNDEYIDIHKLSELTGYKVNTLYKKIPLLTLNEHYFKPNRGKLVFDMSAVDFLIKSTSIPKSAIKPNKNPNKCKKVMTVEDFLQSFKPEFDYSIGE